MPKDQELLEAIDACRPGSADLEQPELRGLAGMLAGDVELRAALERAKRLDQRIGELLRDVPVPMDLRERIERQLVVEPTPVVPASTQGVRSRRQVILRQFIVAGAAACLLAALVNLPQETEYNLEQVYADARGFYLTEAQGAPGPAASLSEEPVPVGYRVSQFIQSARGADVTWRRTKGLFGRQGIAFDLQSADGVRATLYVVKLKKYADRTNLEQILPSHPPVRPLTTENLATGAWQEGDLAYVLVVAGDERSYRRFMAAAGPLA